MKPWQGTMAGLLALGLGSACGGSSSGMPGGGTPDGGGPMPDAESLVPDAAGSIPLTELPPQLARSLCLAFETCYGPLFDLFLNGTDCVSITEQRIRNGTFPLLAGGIDQGKLVYDGTKAQACLDSVAARSCAQMVQRDSPECLAALDGTVPLGGSCVLDEECVGKALCKSTSGACPGQCAPLLVAGQACTKDGDCQDGLVCSPETKLCVLPAGEGQACEYGAPPCGPGLLCLGKDDDQQASGTCITPATALAGVEGGPCEPTQGQLCQSGLACVALDISLLPATITWQCLRVGSYVAGGDCKPGFPDACATGNYCKTDKVLRPLDGTCTPVPVAGEPCGTGSQCQPGAACVAGVCQNLVANGVSCTGDAMCLSEYCGVSGGCEARLPCK